MSQKVSKQTYEDIFVLAPKSLLFISNSSCCQAFAEFVHVSNVAKIVEITGKNASILKFLHII